MNKYILRNYNVQQRIKKIFRNRSQNISLDNILKITTTKQAKPVSQLFVSLIKPFCFKRPQIRKNEVYTVIFKELKLHRPKL